MEITLTDGEYAVATQQLQGDVELIEVAEMLFVQFVLALKIELQHAGFRVCFRCNKYRYTWRFNEDGTINDTDDPAAGEWICADHLTEEQLKAVTEYLSLAVTKLELMADDEEDDDDWVRILTDESLDDDSQPERW